MAISREACTTLVFLIVQALKMLKIKAEDEKNGEKQLARHLPNLKEK